MQPPSKEDLLSAHPSSARSQRKAPSVRRTARIIIAAAVLAAGAAPAAAVAAPHHSGHVHGRRAHAAQCAARRKHPARHKHAACRARRLRKTASVGTATPPVATITGGPAAGSVSTSANATFTFTANRRGGLRCSLDGAPYALCSSPTAVHGLANGPHTFSVYAFSDGLNGPAASVTWSVGTPAAPPTAPAGLTVTPGDTQVTLSWNASTSTAGIAGYRVFRDGSQVAQVQTTTYTDTGLADGTPYNYTVQSVDSAGNTSALSTAVSATPQASPITPPFPTPPPTTPPPAPAPAPAPSGNVPAVTSVSSLASVWQGGAVQCAPKLTSQSPRLRGTLALDMANQPVQGQPAYVFTLPTDTNKQLYPLEACDITTAPRPVGLGTNGYYGLMVYVPVGWTIPNTVFYGVNIEEYHFQNVDGAPFMLQLHPDHVTLAIETGACNNHTTANAGCTTRTNADHLCRSTSAYTCLPGEYAIPPGALVQGQWNEIILHATWTTANTGDVETWYKTKGAGSWTQSVNLSGIPTVQYDVTKGHPPVSYSDLTASYTAGLSAPMSISLGNDVTGSSFAAVAGAMP